MFAPDREALNNNIEDAVVQGSEETNVFSSLATWIKIEKHIDKGGVHSD